jgi:CubicO group peptidase (beta-lactamase class C family)
MSTELTDGRTSIVRAISLKPHKRLLALGIIVLAMYLIAPASAFAEGEVSRAAEPDFAAIDAYIQEDMREVRIPGLALGIVHGDKLVQLESFG